MAAVVGDGNNAVNQDQLVEFLNLRTTVAKNLKLKPDGSPILGACDNVETMRSYLVKCLQGVFKDKSKAFFGDKKWELFVTQTDGTCGFVSRAIIAGVNSPHDSGAFGEAFSPFIR